MPGGFLVRDSDGKEPKSPYVPEAKEEGITQNVDLSKRAEGIIELNVKTKEDSLISYARNELAREGLFKGSKDSLYDGMVAEAVMQLITVFSVQGHSGMSASIVRNLFNHLADYSPISPLTGKEDEWGPWKDMVSKKRKYRYRQNKRDSAVLMEDDGSSYYIDALLWREQGSTACFNGTIADGETGKHISSSQEIEFPFTPKKFYIVVKALNPGSEFETYQIIDRSQLDEARKIYKKLP